MQVHYKYCSCYNRTPVILTLSTQFELDSGNYLFTRTECNSKIPHFKTASRITTADFFKAIVRNKFKSKVMFLPLNGLAPSNKNHVFWRSFYRKYKLLAQKISQRKARTKTKFKIRTLTGVKFVNIAYRNVINLQIYILVIIKKPA